MGSVARWVGRSGSGRGSGRPVAAGAGVALSLAAKQHHRTALAAKWEVTELRFMEGLRGAWLQQIEIKTRG